MKDHDQQTSLSLTEIVIANLHSIKKTDVKNVNLKIDSKTGKEELEVNLTNGRTLIQTNFPSGIYEKSVVDVPKFNSVSERNQAVQELKKSGKTQMEIARLLGCSQTTVHNALK
jgi:DNA-binding NarL/FixJ family response regulator